MHFATPASACYGSDGEWAGQKRTFAGRCPGKSALLFSLRSRWPRSPCPAKGIVILTIDVSGSMAATDLEPTRLEVAKEAAKARPSSAEQRPHRGGHVQR
jgi:hypothetical protein